jgi:DNA-binding response OmpR family regulator
MAKVYVLILTRDADVGQVLDIYLRSEGHVVLSTTKDNYAWAVLRASAHPAVVLLHPPLGAADVFDCLQQAADDASGRLRRHRYIVAMAQPQSMQSALRDLMARLDVTVFALPFDLDELAAAVREGVRDTPLRPGA